MNRYPIFRNLEVAINSTGGKNGFSIGRSCCKFFLVLVQGKLCMYPHISTLRIFRMRG